MVLSTKGLSVAQQQAVLAELSLANATGKLTTAQMTEILTTKSRSKADAEALLLNAGLITSETTEATATNVVTASKLKELVQTKALTQAEAELIAAKAGVTLANQKESTSFLAGVGSKIKGLGSGLKSARTGVLALVKAHPVIAGITTALTIGTVAVGIYKKKQEEAAQTIKEAYENAKTAIDEINSTFENTKSTTESITKEYAELAQGVNLLTNENKKLSTEKYERFLELSNQLSMLYPSLTKDFDDNGNAILDLSGDVDTIVGSLNDLVSVQEQLANQKIVEQMPALFEGYRNNVSVSKKQLDNAEKTKSDIEKAYEVLSNWDSSTVWWANGDNVSGTGSMGEYVNALETLGIAYKKVAVDLNNDPYKNSDGFSIEADYDEFGTELHDIYVDKFNKASDEVKYAKMQLESETSSINQYLNTWLQTEFSYNQIEDDGLKQAIRESLFNFDWNSLPKDIDKNDWKAVSEYLRRNILFSVNNIDDTSVSQSLANIYIGALTSGELLNAIEKVQSYFGDKDPISLSLKTKVSDIEPLMNSVKDKLKGTEFDDKVGELSLGDLEIAADLKVSDDSIQSWDELIAKIEEAKESASADSFTSFIDTLNSADNAEIKDELLELAKSGEITPEILSSTKEYADLLSQTGTSAESATNQILDLLTAQEKLAGFSQGLDKLKTAYDEFKDEDIGFVTAETLESLPDSFKNLPEFDLFSQIASDPTSGTESIQQAFNDIVKAYMLSQDTLQSLVNANEHDIQSYIANLRQMNVTNADEVVNTAMQALNSENELINSAEAELEVAYKRHLENKNYDYEKYLTNQSSQNTALVNALGETYKADYNNWCELLSAKATAYNKFVDALEESGITYDSDKSVYENAQDYIKANNYSPAAIDRINRYASEAELAEYKADKAKEVLKLDLSPITTNFGTNTSSSASNSSSDSQKEVTIETFDFIETAIKRIEAAIDKLKTKAENTFIGFAARAAHYTSLLQKNTEEINLQSNAYAQYMAKANAVGLPEEYASQVRNGSLNIADITDDTIKEQIKDYETWYEKAQECLDKVEELKITQTELLQAKIELLITKYEKLAEKAENANEQLQNKINLREAWGFSAKATDYSGMNKNIITQIDNITKQNEQLEQLKSTVEKGSESWLEYNSRIDENKSSLQHLKKEMAENAAAMAELAKAKAERKVSSYDQSDELLDAKISNSTKYTTKNKYLNQELLHIDKRQNVYNEAVKTDLAGIKSTSKSINKTKVTKENKSLFKKIQSYIKANKEIPTSLLEKAANLSDNGALYNKCVQYNAYLDSYETDKYTATSLQNGSVTKYSDE